MENRDKFGAVLFASDLATLTRFYVAVTGLVVTQSEPDFVVLESPSLQLILHGIPAAIAQSIVVGSPPHKRTDTAIKLIFPVPSLAAARAVASERGGGMNAQDQEFAALGFRACDGYDPEGNVIQLRARIL